MSEAPEKEENYMSKLNSGKSTAGTRKPTKKAAVGGMNFGWNTTAGFGTINTSAYNTSYAKYVGTSPGIPVAIPIFA